MYSPMFERMGAITGLIVSRCSPQKRDVDGRRARGGLSRHRGARSRRGARRDGRASHRRRGHPGGRRRRREGAGPARAAARSRRMNKPQRGAPLTAPLIHADRLFPTDIATRTIARRLYAEVRDLPIVSPHGHTDPRWYRGERGVSRSREAVRHSGPLHFPHAVQPGRAARGNGHRAEGWRRGRDRRAQDLAQVRRELSPVPRHADAALARPVVLRIVRHDGAALGRDRGPVFRPHLGVPRQAGIPPARAVRAIQDRGDRHHREPARSAGAPQGDRRIRLEGPRGHRLPARPGDRSGVRRLPRTTWRNSATSRAATRSPGTAISRRTGCAAPSSSSTARPRPTTATSRRRPSISRRPMPSGCSPRSRRRISPRAMPSCSAPRC